VSEIFPGWYKDPVDASVQRYWDGEGWLGDPIPADAPAPSGPPPGAKPPAAFTKPVKAPPTGSGTDDPPPLAGITPLPVPRGVPLPPNAPVPVALPPGMPLPPGTIKLPPDAVPPGMLPPGAIPVLLPPGLRFAALPPIARPQVRPHGHAIAPLGSRVVARLVDMTLVLVLNAAVNGWFVYRFWQKFYPAYRQAAAGANASDSATAGFQSLMVVVLVLAAALWFAYEVPATANSGQTVGKRLMGIKVMALDNPAPLGFGRAIRRWNPLGLPTLLWPCGVGFILQLLDSVSPVVDWPLHRAFHDRSAGTVVIRVEAASDAGSDSDSTPRAHAESDS